MSARGQAQPPPGGRPDEQRFTPDQAARALQRAVTLNHERLDSAAADMSLNELLELGREIGLSSEDVRTAAAMERFDDFTDRAHRVVRVAGPVVASGQRVVDGEHDDVARRLDEWVRVAHCMKVRERDRDATHWEPAAGLAGSLMRGARSIAGEPALEGVKGITTRVAPVGDGRCVVRVEVDPGSRSRAWYEALGAGGAIGVAGVAAAVVTTPLWLLLVPVGAVATTGMVINRRRKAAEAEREIQRLMSGVAHGDRPPSALDAVRGRVRRSK